MKIRLSDWIEERSERTTVSDQHPVLTCSQDGILLQSTYFKKQIASQDNTGYKIVHRGDFTYRAMSDTGRFYIHQMDCAEIGIVSPAYPVFCLREGSPIVPEYLLLFFESELFHELVSSKSKGSTRLSLRLSKIEDIVVDFPSVEEQNKRVALMNSLSQQIEEVGRREKSYDDAVKSLFIEMFGDPSFDTQSRGTKPLSEFILNIKYGTSQPPKFNPRGRYKFIRATNIKNGTIVEKDMLRIDEEEASKISKCKLQFGDFIMVRSGALTGDTCVITKDYEGEYAGYDIIITLDQTRINPFFLNALVNTDYMAKVVKPMTGRAAQPHINSAQVSSLPIINVAKEDQDKFASTLNQIDKLRFNTARQKALFIEYRSSFLQDFFEGGVKHE